MNTPSETPALLVRLAAEHVRVWAADGKLRFDGALSDEDEDRLRALKPQLLAMLDGAAIDPRDWWYSWREKVAAQKWHDYAWSLGKRTALVPTGVRWVRFGAAGDWHPLTDPPDRIY